MLLGFFVAGLLDAKAIETRISGEPLGASRSVALALLKPMTLLSGALQLDRPAAGDRHRARPRAAARTTRWREAAQQKPLWPRRVTYAHPLRMYVAGDSMAQVFGSSLVNLAEKTNVIVGKLDYHVSTGLSRPDFFDWPQRLIDMIVEQKPDAAVDALRRQRRAGRLRRRQGPQGRLRRLAPGLRAARRARRWTSSPREGAACTGSGTRSCATPCTASRISMMDHIYQDEARKHPGVTYIPTWSLFTDKKGSYAGLPARRQRRPRADARSGRHPPHARRRRPHGPGRARRDREGLEDPQQPEAADGARGQERSA